MIYVVTRNASCYSDHDFSTMAVEVDDYPAALKRISQNMYGDIEMEHYLRSKRFHVSQRYRFNGSTTNDWDDQWVRYAGVSTYEVEGWIPGSEAPQCVWKVCFDKWFKRTIVEDDLSDEDIRKTWPCLRGDVQAMQRFTLPKHEVTNLKQPGLTEKQRQDWVKQYGYEGECAEGSMDSG